VSEGLGWFKLNSIYILIKQFLLFFIKQLVPILDSDWSIAVLYSWFIYHCATLRFMLGNTSLEGVCIRLTCTFIIMTWH